jgi:membrane carboxypeptidase/penicillin-binding protein PbpC
MPVRALEILCPAQAGEYILTGEPHGDRLRLRASLDEEMPLHWYQDGFYLGASSPEKPLQLDLKEGRHKVACMTPSGDVRRVEFEVVRPSADIRFDAR